MRKFVPLALVLALTGCAVQSPSPSITPVDLKYCALSDAAGFNDDGLNRSVYAAVQQLKVQTGASVMAIEVSDKQPPKTGIDKLIESGCNAIITSGESLVAPALSAAKANSTTKFISVSDVLNTDSTVANFSSITFNIYQAAYAAGYLAAAETENNGEVAVLNLINDFGSRKTVRAFTAGVARFNTQNRSQVKLKNILTMKNENQEVVFVLSGSSADLGELSLGKDTKIIGYDRDWYTDSRNKDLRPNILTSVIRVDVVDKVAKAVIEGTASTSFDLTNAGVGLSSSHDLNWPTAFTNELDQITKDFIDGKVKVN